MARVISCLVIIGILVLRAQEKLILTITLPIRTRDDNGDRFGKVLNVTFYVRF